MSWFPNLPPSQGDQFSWFRWFQQAYRYFYGENRTHHPNLAAASNLSEDFLYPVDATAAPVTVTLPLAANYQYKKFCVKKIDASANAVTIAASGSDTIDGDSSVSLAAQYDSGFLVSDGVSKWFVITAGSGGGGTGPTGPAGADGADGVFAFSGVMWLTMQGPGGGGGSTSGTSQGAAGGGSGEACDGLQIFLTPGGSYSYSIPNGGAADTDGGTTTFGSFSCVGGKKGQSGTGGSSGGRGGGVGGGAGGVAGNGVGAVGSSEAANFFGGSGGGGGQGGSGSSGNGGGSGGYLLGGVATSNPNGSGGGGGASIYSAGGSGGSGASGGNASSYGGGGGGAGGGAGGKAGGTGGGGYALVCWPGGSTEFLPGTSGTFVAPT